MKYASERAASRGSEEVKSSELYGRWRHEITVAILRRRAAMTRAVLPRSNPRARWLMAGHSDGEAAVTTRAPQLDGDDVSGGGGEPDDAVVDDGDGSLHEGMV